MLSDQRYGCCKSVSSILLMPQPRSESRVNGVGTGWGFYLGCLVHLLTLSELDPGLLTKTDPPKRRILACANSAPTPIGARQHLHTANYDYKAEPWPTKDLRPLRDTFGVLDSPHFLSLHAGYGEQGEICMGWVQLSEHKWVHFGER